MGMTNEEREKEIRKQPIPTKEECLAFYKELMKLADVRFVPYYKMAIKALEQQTCKDCISIGVFEQVKWERDVAIEQLEQLGYSLGEKIRTSEDCISREQTLKAFAEKCGGECACCEYNGSGYDTAENCKLIKSMPSVTPSRPIEQEPRQGHWIKVTNGRGGHECDVCHDYAPSFQNGDEYLSAYCPNCGADMTESKGVNTDEDSN